MALQKKYFLIKWTQVRLKLNGFAMLMKIEHRIYIILYFCHQNFQYGNLKKQNEDILTLFTNGMYEVKFKTIVIIKHFKSLFYKTIEFLILSRE